MSQRRRFLFPLDDNREAYLRWYWRWIWMWREEKSRQQFFLGISFSIKVEDDMVHLRFIFILLVSYRSSHVFLDQYYLQVTFFGGGKWERDYDMYFFTKIELKVLESRNSIGDRKPNQRIIFPNKKTCAAIRVTLPISRPLPVKIRITVQSEPPHHLGNSPSTGYQSEKTGKNEQQH